LLGLPDALGEVLRRPDACADPGAVADGIDRLALRKACDSRTVSMAFFETPGTLWLYSPETTR